MRAHSRGGGGGGGCIGEEGGGGGECCHNPVSLFWGSSNSRTRKKGGPIIRACTFSEFRLYNYYLAPPFSNFGSSYVAILTLGNFISQRKISVTLVFPGMCEISSVSSEV